MAELPAGYVNARHDADRANLAPIKVVVTRPCLSMDGGQVRIDCQAWTGMSGKALELRMVLVAPGLSAKNSTRQQSLAPQRDQALCI